ncbi:hypothetical protein [Microvirga sp. M2]|uniref:hypothetical protein n=1 Tax=Microvirga sp. M2 TaxID=3073270 RepID=UPI0039C0A3B0
MSLILFTAAAMITRFEKALEQAARAGEVRENRPASESRAQKVRRLEELIRAKEASGDRIVVGIGAALVICATALPVYAAFLRDGYVYLPSIGTPVTGQGGSTGERIRTASPSQMEALEAKATFTHSVVTPARSGPSGAAPLPRYVIHRATEGSALIEGPNGLWWVTPGMKVPGAGHILSIEHSEAGWAVVTSETTITEVTN